MLNKLKKLNPDLNFLTADDDCKLFKKIDCNTDEIVSFALNVEVQEENYYVASDTCVEKLSIISELQNKVFAELEIQAGWCCGGNCKINGMEWHKSSEVVIACTDMVLFLGDYFDIKNDIYDSKKTIALFLRKGEAVELLPLTLHLSPNRVNELFKATIILPKGTNLPLENGINGTLRAKNKWLLVHKDNLKGVANGGKVGITGENIQLYYED